MMNLLNPKIVIRKLFARYKKILISHPTIFQKVILVNEYPRSGASWLSRLLSDLLGIPFDPHRFMLPSSSFVIHGHYPYYPDSKNVIVMIRDGRDIMVSFYYHSLFIKENARNREAVLKHRKKLNFEDINDIFRYLPRFIEYTFTGMDFPPFTWKSFMEQWLGKGLPTVRYEDLLVKPLPVLDNLLTSTFEMSVKQETIKDVLDSHSFEKETMRKPGQEKIGNHLRKGISGDWKTKFRMEARQVFDHYAGDTLIELGYEPDRSWVLADLQ